MHIESAIVEVSIMAYSHPSVSAITFLSHQLNHNDN